MSVEGGPAGGMGGGVGAAVSAGPAVSVGPSISVGIEGGSAGAASVSGLARLDSSPAPAVDSFGGLKAEGFKFSPDWGRADIGQIVNEGQVGFMDFKNTMPVQTSVLNPSGEIRFAPQAPEAGAPVGAGVMEPVKTAVPDIVKQAFDNEPDFRLDPDEDEVMVESEPVKNKAAVQPGVIGDAVYWLTDVSVESRVIKPAKVIMPKAEPAATPLMVVPDILEYPKPQIAASPALGPMTETKNASGVQAGIQTETGSMVSAETAPVVSTQPAVQEQEIEEIIEEVIHEKTAMVEEEETERIRRKYVVDERALSQVVVEVKQAVVKAKELAKKLGITLTGKLVGMFVPGQHEGNESEAVKGIGADGSIPERQQSIESLGEFSSEVQAEEKSVREAHKKPPVKIRPEGQGQPAKNEDVARVFRYRLVKPVQEAHEEVTRRAVKKKVVFMPQAAIEPVLPGEKKEVKAERTLEELNPQLAGVFQKAA